ncbi:MAG: hypothetical protein M3303_07350, partial [Gemmatimonadota bacterium]|nr:hypothetical protein [Gemmatimonadota bacterium]
MRMRAWIGMACMSVAVAALPAGAPAQGLPPIPIPQDPSDEASVPAFAGAPATPRGVAAPDVPRHPHMAPNGASNTHNDAYQTDTYTGPGPLGDRMSVISSFFVAECGTVTFDREGRIVSVCVGLQGPFVALIEPRDLSTLAVFPLPPRRLGAGSTGLLTDVGGGGYFYLDDRDRAVIPTQHRHIWVVAQERGAAGPGFRLVRDYDLTSAVGLDDQLFSALPDWSGRLWFVSQGGVVGTVDPASGAVRSVQLAGEEIDNSFAVDETGGVYVVSDKALYRFDAAASGAPAVSWRVVYPNSGIVKPSQFGAGSGTTPTLMGRDLVAITDNADPMNVAVYRRARQVAGDRLVCLHPVFAKGASATENSLIGTGTSLVVENNYGYTGPTATQGGGVTSPGLERIDLDPRGGCHRVWRSEERAPSVVAKMSLGTGLVYTYTKAPNDDGVDAWYFTALDFVSGRTVYRRLAGTGLGHNNNYAPVSIGPDGTAYVGVLGGLVSLRDAVPPRSAPPAQPSARRRSIRLKLVLRRRGGRLRAQVTGPD